LIPDRALQAQVKIGALMKVLSRRLGRSTPAARRLSMLRPALREDAHDLPVWLQTHWLVLELVLCEQSVATVALLAAGVKHIR
jgi:hypothetical protein